MADSYAARQWILVLSLTALLLSLAILGQIVSQYIKAYLDAPGEVSAFLDTIDSSIVENESYDHDISKLKRQDDRIRLNRLLREIQKGGDALREDLNALTEGEDGSPSPRLKPTARLFWASHRRQLEEKVRRVDLLRMRFLVVHMGIITGAAAATEKKNGTGGGFGRGPTAPRDAEKWSSVPRTPVPPPIPRPLPDGLSEGIKSKPPLRRLTLHAIGHPDPVDGGPRKGWAGVMQELQRSPVLRERHASIELAMAKAY